MSTGDAGQGERRRHLTAAGEDRRADIVSQAERLFAEHGYAKTRMTDIATAAGVTKGLLYWYFENKQALIAEILASTRRRLRDEQRHALARIDDPLASLYVGTAVSARFILTNFRLYLVSGEGVDRNLAATLGQARQAHASDAARLIESGQAAGLIRADVAPLALAHANAGVINNLCGAAHYGGLPASVDEVARTAAGYVLRACAATPDLVAAVESAHPLDR